MVVCPALELTPLTPTTLFTMLGLGLFSRPLLQCEPSSPSSFPPPSSSSSSKGYVAPHLRGPNPEDAAGQMVAPIPENLAKEGGLAWWTPYTQSMPKSRSAQWVSLAVYWVEKEGAMDREGREGGRGR